MAIKVLIADDAPFIREVLRQLLEDQGFEVVGEAENGKQAVDLTKSLRPDVVIMDLVMPEKSGLEASQEIAAIKGAPKIIACSTIDDESMVMKAINSGCSDYVYKPFQADQLVSKIKAMVNTGG